MRVGLRTCRWRQHTQICKEQRHVAGRGVVTRGLLDAQRRRRRPSANEGGVLARRLVLGQVILREGEETSKLGRLRRHVEGLLARRRNDCHLVGANLVDDAAGLEDSFRPTQHHLTARHHVRNRGVLDDCHRHPRRRELLRCPVAVALWMRLCDDDREMLRLRGGEQQRDDDA